MAKKSLVLKAQREPKFKVRGYLRRFQMCRICFRNLALRGEIPGVIKASW